MKLGRLCEDDDGQYFVVPVGRVDEFWLDHKKAFKSYPIELCKLSETRYYRYLDKWGDYMVDDYKNLDILMENPLYYDEALKAIADFQSPEELRELDLGLSYEEVLEMAYENIIFMAKRALR